MGAPKISTPAAPDPVATAAAQTAMNKETAIAQAGLNATDQVGPNGSLTYSQSGNWADGTPHYTATQTYSPVQQQLDDLNNQTQVSLGKTGLNQSQRIGELLSTPADYSSDAINKVTAGMNAVPQASQYATGGIESGDRLTQQLFDAGSKRLAPVLAQSRDAAETEAANKGLRSGSTGYERAMTQQDQAANDAYNQLFLTGQAQAYGQELSSNAQNFGQANTQYGNEAGQRTQALSEIAATRNQPLNEISALLSGSQVTAPTWVNTPNTSVQPTDYTGLVGSIYNGQVSAANSANQARAATTSGLYSGIGSIFGSALKLSDERLKTDITKLGTDPDSGHGVFAFRYKPEAGVGDERMQIGLMAQDVEKRDPEAVVTLPSGVKAVDYAQAMSGIGRGFNRKRAA